VKAQDLIDDDANAEKDLAGELWKQVRHEVTASFYQAQVALRGAVLDQAMASRPARLVAGLRGDA
jgi:glucose-6-phosphate-specific signal transduction histidine kinase